MLERAPEIALILSRVKNGHRNVGYCHGSVSNDRSEETT